jgi:hypothetical protein
MKVNGKMIKQMVMVLIFILMVLLILVFGKKINKMEKEKKFGLMVHYMKVIIKKE